MLAAEADGEPVLLQRSCPALDVQLLETDESLDLNILMKLWQQVSCNHAWNGLQGVGPEPAMKHCGLYHSQHRTSYFESLIHGS